MCEGFKNNMGFLQVVGWFGVRWWVWLYFGFSIIMGLCILAYWHREKLRKTYYELRFAERIIKVVIHYESRLYREYWRLIPEEKQFMIANQIYAYDDKAVLKDNDFFTTEEKGNTIITINGIKYNFDELAGIKHKSKKHIEIHYFFNIPSPINFEIKDKDIKLTSTDLEKMKENDLFTKLLTLGENKGLLAVILLILIGVAGGVAFIIARMMEMI